jgi:hypothetical protein
LRDILPAWEDDPNLMVAPLRLVVLFQALPKLVRVNADQRVPLRVETGVAAEGIQANAKLRDLLRQALKTLLAQIDKQAGEFRRTIEDIGRQDRRKLGFIPLVWLSPAIAPQR